MFSSQHQSNSQLNDDQVEELVREYSQLVEENSQAFQFSESEHFSEETPQPAPIILDYQAEFMKFMKPDEVELVAQAISTFDPASQLDYNSQSDVETVIRTYMTENPQWNENIASKPFNIESYLESRDFLVTIKSGKTHEPIRSTAANQKNKEKTNLFTLGPLPLEIEDILRIATASDDAQRWYGYQKIYGQRFKTVMFYGRTKAKGTIRSQENRNVRLYEVDDGSGMIIVHFPHFDRKYSALSLGVEKLFDDLDLARKEGIAFLGAEHYGPRSVKCKEMLNHLNIIANVIKRNSAIKQDFFTHGSKVCVIGRAFSHIDGTNHVFAYHMIEDTGINRDFEIKFKQHLLEVYETKYMKFKVTGEPIHLDK